MERVTISKKSRPPLAVVKEIRYFETPTIYRS